MNGSDCVVQRWRSYLGLTIAGVMLVWGRLLEPGSAPWLSELYAAYWVLCVIASAASIALAWQESMGVWRQERLKNTRSVRQAHAEFGLAHNAITETPRA